ncbi:TolC family protein [Ferrimonas balearica]|uniref:TolC family protein n=1 Tax=Ferrimonas balearica TaxID=44012 RepID=UPI001C98F803|nr:TolC family protein [Ferrimonas balearica]MBY5991312.1 TolC family protein [Ferrimonas balearica]
MNIRFIPGPGADGASKAGARRRRRPRHGLWAAGVLTLSLLTQTNVQSQELNLAEVMEQTLLHHPQLQLFPFEQRRAEALALQAGIRPNPKLALSAENLLGSGKYQGVDGAELTLTFSQLVELGEKRQRRVDLAQAQQRQQVQAYEQLRLDVLAEAASRYYELLRLQALVAWNQQRIQTEQEAVAQITERARAGAVLQADVTRMRLRLAQSQAELGQLNNAQAQAQRRLAAMWSAEPDFERVQGRLSRLQAAPSAADALNAAQNAPRYLTLLSSERVAEANRRLQEANQKWDLSYGVGVKHTLENDDTGLVFNLSVPLHLSDPNQGNLLAARAEQDRVMHQQSLARTELRLTVLDLHRALSDRLAQVQHLERELLPLAESWLSEMVRAYQAGRVDVRALLDAQSQQFELQRQRIEMQAEAWQQRLALERLLGQPLTPTTQTMTPETP